MKALVWIALLIPMKVLSGTPVRWVDMGCVELAKRDFPAHSICVSMCGGPKHAKTGNFDGGDQWLRNQITNVCTSTIILPDAADFRAVADEAAKQHEENVRQLLELLKAQQAHVSVPVAISPGN